MPEIDSFVDEISSKYNYSEELSNAIKRVLPAMIDGKDKE